MEQQREKAVAILEALEDILDDNDITVPCDEADEEDREENEDAARLYGSPYYDLEDAVTEIIEDGGTDKEIISEIKEQLSHNGVNLLDENKEALTTLTEKVSEIIGA